MPHVRALLEDGIASGASDRAEVLHEGWDTGGTQRVKIALFLWRNWPCWGGS